MHRIRHARSDDEILRCHPILVQLRPALRLEELVPLVRKMEHQGFRLAYLEEDGRVRAVAGYRLVEMLRTGPMLEVDDLVTDADARSGGYGHALFEWLVEEARSNGCSVLELDSGVMRHHAHRFYLRERMHILGYHFSLTIGASSPERDAQLAGLPT
jgi:GNAT superfamily N-acetyltransferase